MKRLIFGVVLFLSFPIFGKQLLIKNSANLRSNEKNFFSQQNVIGQITKGAIVTVIDERTLPSGNKAYKISLPDTKPQSSIKSISHLKEVWIYGSSKFVESSSKKIEQKIEAGLPTDKCDSCANSESPLTAPFKPILEHIEVSSAQPASEDKSLLRSDANSALDKVNNLIKSGFSCNKSEESVKIRGYVCTGKLSNYDQNVRIYVPEKLDSTKPSQFNLFFHGLRNSETFKENSTGTGVGDFGAMLKNANDNNSILVVPESINVRCGTSAKGEALYCTGSYYQFTNNPDLIFKLKSDIEAKANIKLGKLTLSGHSGAGSIINMLLGKELIRKNVDKVAIYDALYGDSTHIRSWVKESSKHKLGLAWIQGAGSSTQNNTNEFIRNMNSHLDQIKLLRVIGSIENTHMSIMQKAGFSDFLKN